jgi:hypothetical protein
MKMKFKTFTRTHKLLFMQHSKDQATPGQENENKRKSDNPKGEQQQTDPQITELKGFADPSEDLEPTLEDGTKSPDKEPPPNVNT